MPDTNAQAVASTNNSGTTESTAVEPTSEPNTNTNDTEEPVDPNASPTPTIMDFLMSDARHIQGDAAAPVTLIEFADFK
jgi:hypothetical protein